MSIHRLDPPIPVEIVSANLPEGIELDNRRGWCYGWDTCGIDGHRIWIVVLDVGGGVVDVPQPEIRVDRNWSYGRRS